MIEIRAPQYAQSRRQWAWLPTRSIALSRTMIRMIKRLVPKRLKALLRKWGFEFKRCLVICERKRHRADRTSPIGRLLSEGWTDYTTDLHPKDRRMTVLAEKEIVGMSTENIRFLINETVRRYAPGGVYLEVGMYQGCSLLSAAVFNPSTRCIGVDNFSEFDDEGTNESKLKENLRKLGNPANVEYYSTDYCEFFERFETLLPGVKINVYYYDGNHSYENQKKGLSLSLPYLADRCVIFVDDINVREIDRANRDWLKEHPDFKSLFKIKTVDNIFVDWWNGFELIARL